MHNFGLDAAVAQGLCDDTIGSRAFGHGNFATAQVVERLDRRAGARHQARSGDVEQYREVDFLEARERNRGGAAFDVRPAVDDCLQAIAWRSLSRNPRRATRGRVASRGAPPPGGTNRWRIRSVPLRPAPRRRAARQCDMQSSVPSRCARNRVCRRTRVPQRRGRAATNRWFEDPSPIPPTKPSRQVSGRHHALSFRRGSGRSDGEVRSTSWRICLRQQTRMIRCPLSILASVDSGNLAKLSIRSTTRTPSRP